MSFPNIKTSFEQVTEFHRICKNISLGKAKEVLGFHDLDPSLKVTGFKMYLCHGLTRYSIQFIYLGSNKTCLSP